MSAMDRRTFALNAAGLAGALALAGASGRAAAQGAPVEGRDFQALAKPIAVPANGKIEVIEFFWYACPHCNAFEPTLVEWLKRLPKDIAFKRVPVNFQDSFIPPQKLYYTLEALGQLDALHGKVFNAIHVEHQRLDKDDLVIAWAVKQGLDKTKFTETYQSFGVSTKVRKASQLQQAYQVAGVPALGVAGKFYTDGSQAQTMPRALVVVEYLVAEQRKKA